MSVFEDLVIDDTEMAGFKTLRDGDDIEKWCNNKGYRLNEKVTNFLADNYKKLNKLAIMWSGDTDLILLPDGKLTDKLEEGEYGWAILYMANYFKAFQLILDDFEIKAYSKENSPLIIVFNNKIVVAVAPKIEEG